MRKEREVVAEGGLRFETRRWVVSFEKDSRVGNVVVRGNPSGWRRHGSSEGTSMCKVNVVVKKNLRKVSISIRGRDNTDVGSS